MPEIHFPHRSHSGTVHARARVLGSAGSGDKHNNSRYIIGFTVAFGSMLLIVALYYLWRRGYLHRLFGKKKKESQRTKNNGRSQGAGRRRKQKSRWRDLEWMEKLARPQPARVTNNDKFLV